MCGIIGIVGKQPVTERLMDSLKRLEYRGYDSAGVATIVGGKIERRRAQGKIRALEDRLLNEPLSGTIGIGHTRWATHGGVTDANAHPHVSEDGKVAVIHNGIIENFAELKAELIAAGRTFESDTDTEVIAQLIDSYLDAGQAPLAAFKSALDRLTGAYTAEVRHEEEVWRNRGISAVPSVIFNQRWMIQGGQPPHVFEQAIRQIVDGSATAAG